MATKIIENITGTDVEITDLGITVIAGSTYDLSSKPKEVVANSDDLITQLGLGNLVVQKDPMADPITYYDISESVRALFDFHESMPKGSDEYKIAVHSSAKPTRTDTPHGFNTHWCGAADDVENHLLGQGPLCYMELTPGTASLTRSFEFDPLFGRVFMLHGYFGYDNAGPGDYFSIADVANATPLQELFDLDLELDGNKIKFADGGEGSGTHGFAGSPVLVPNLSGAGYWNYTAENGLEPSFDQSGYFDFYNVEVEVDRFMNRIPVFGSNHVTMSLEAADYSELPPGHKLVMTAYNNSNTTWKIWAFLECYRERSVDGNL